ncbi:hypothetical protein Q8A73_006052 [Channa argus]|nr:hypothetical protein Q8A73_006052 [Channa argus]
MYGGCVQAKAHTWIKNKQSSQAMLLQVEPQSSKNQDLNNNAISCSAAEIRFANEGGKGELATRVGQKHIKAKAAEEEKVGCGEPAERQQERLWAGREEVRSTGEEFKVSLFWKS